MGIATILMDRGLISGEQLELALAEHRQSGERLDHVLVRLGMARPDAITRAVGEQFGLDIVDLSDIRVDDEVLKAIPPQVVFRQLCVPIERIEPKNSSDEGALRVATSDPFELTIFDELRLITGCPIELVLAEEEDLRDFIRANYGVGGDTLEQMARDRGDDVTLSDEAADADDEAEAAQEASVIRLVNDLLFEAIDSRATDVHIEPYEGKLVVRYRIDGVLQRANVPQTIHTFSAAIISRIKIMSSLNIAEKRTPQDGRITIKRKGGEYDLRVSVIPMLYGEGVVLRILNKSAVLFSLDELGMPEDVVKRWDSLITKPHGILLVTGPTGSGKSTTLYASLNRIISDEVKAITVEDPVEYHVAGVNQIQVNSKVGLTFSAGLRAILRHDPDVIMIGEIRDKETADAAVQASLTGHLVFSTLHTNDAAGAMPRMLDMGVEPYLVASSIEGVLAQRLVRRICSTHNEPYTPEPHELPDGFELPESGELTRGVPAKANNFTGYRGRVGIYELLVATENVREVVMKRGNASEIARTAAKEDAISTMRDDGFTKVVRGMTTLSEVMRVTKV
jgi:general secretion pathway protein E/type IV pilus assembly protein PilB